MRMFGCVMALGLMTAVAACGSSSPAAPGAATAAITVTASPSSITGILCVGCGAGSTDREAETTLTIQEAAGVAATITAIDMTLREQASSAVIASGTFDGAAVIQIAGTNRVTARGTLNVRCGVHYGAAQAGRAAALTYVVRLTDDRGNQVSQTITVNTTT